MYKDKSKTNKKWCYCHNYWYLQ